MKNITPIGFKLSLAILGISVVSGCSYIYSEDGLVKDRTYEYLDAKQSKELIIPNDLKQENKVNFAQVPAIGDKAKGAPVGKDLSTNAPVQILAVIENTRQDKTGDNPAVFVNDDAAFVWQSITSLMEEYEISPVISDESRHYLDTGWVAQDERGVWLGLEPQDDIDEFKSRYVFTFGEGTLPGEIRVEVERVGAQKFDDESDSWKDTPSFWQDSAEMLNLFIAHYDKRVGEREKHNRERVIAGMKMELSKDVEGNPAFVTKANIEDVWSKTPRVMRSLNFEVKDKDRRLMTYYMEFEAEEPGFFASLFDEDKPKFELEDGSYQVTLSSVGDMTALVLKDAQGVPLEASLVTKLYPAISKQFGTRR
ncbi:outer membrane protein assembly factor BamC [Aliikangiella sp. G2MR2-5]|uniref:outer membrane protein assembly factor BamC n=1 Tax=Aliikangiella sp. G2MR2-5 TaxID=2788943 RepID=UPI0018AC0A22|nr:outer membrane protein assembly factor BamC [Aliikangiella sp. G2MR2-5]